MNDLDEAMISNNINRSALTAFFLIFISTFVFWTEGYSTSKALGNQSNYYRIILTFLSAFLCLFVLSANTRRIHLAVSNPSFLLLVYGFLALISGLYLDSNSLYTMWKGLEVVVASAVAMSILACNGSKNYARKPYKIAIYIMSTLIIVYWLEAPLFPKEIFVEQTGYKGIFGVLMQGYIPPQNANGLGFWSAVVTFAMVCNLTRSYSLKKRIQYFFIIGLAFPMLILSQARTSILGLLIAVIAFVLVYYRQRILAVFGILLLISLLFYQFGPEIIDFMRRGQPDSHLENLSGRVIGWKLALSRFTEAPWLGHGFIAFSRTQIVGGGGNLHGSIFEVLVGVGIVGLLPWVVAIMWTSSSLLSLAGQRRRTNANKLARSYDAEMIGILCLTIFRGITSSVLAEHGTEFMLLLALIVYAFATKQAEYESWIVKTKTYRWR